MAVIEMIEYSDAQPEVKAIYDDIMAVRTTDRINNFWKMLANCPNTLRRIWDGIKEVMAPAQLDALTKELIYIAVSATNNCSYCIHSHIAAARSKGMTDAMLNELIAVVSMANQTNALANSYQIPVDEVYKIKDSKAGELEVKNIK